MCTSSSSFCFASSHIMILAIIRGGKEDRDQCLFTARVCEAIHLEDSSICRNHMQWSSTDQYHLTYVPAFSEHFE
jgi:hypothetical protein